MIYVFFLYVNDLCFFLYVNDLCFFLYVNDLCFFSYMLISTRQMLIFLFVQRDCLPSTSATSFAPESFSHAQTILEPSYLLDLNMTNSANLFLMTFLPQIIMDKKTSLNLEKKMHEPVLNKDIYTTIDNELIAIFKLCLCILSFYYSTDI